MTSTDAREICQSFANRHRIVFADKGECGFGRPCVGFLHGNNYIDYNPCSYGSHPNYEVRDLVPHDDRLCAPAGVDAYHKHDCMAVLASTEDYDTAIIQLAQWVRHLESCGEVEIVEYRTGATGIQAMLSGLLGRAVTIKSALATNAVDPVAQPHTELTTREK